MAIDGSPARTDRFSQPRWRPQPAEALGGLATWQERLRVHLHEPRFWIVQGLVLVVTFAHYMSELFIESRFGGSYFLPVSLYFFPVVYASLTFGREGAVPTAVWSAALATPNVLLLNHGIERVGEAFQLTLMVLLAVVVATRVDRERTARRQAEGSEAARALSETKYRLLFERAGAAILVVDSRRVVREANAAAAALLDRPLASLAGAPLESALGPEGDLLVAASLEDGGAGTPDLLLTGGDGREVWLQLSASAIPTPAAGSLVQIVLRNVTDRRDLQSYAGEIVRAQEEERQRIAQELHDVSLQSAVLICRRLDSASEAAKGPDETRALAAIEEARHEAEGMADELRRFSRDLRPFVLEDLGLVPAVKQLITELRERSQLQCRLSVTGEVRRLEPVIELTLFRIAQQALRNAERHASASRVMARMSYREESVELAVTDDGIGFDLPADAELVRAGRLGLVGMRERALLCGGRCLIRSARGEGTSVEVTMPAARA